jgi:hypothetical protein
MPALPELTCFARWPVIVLGGIVVLGGCASQKPDIAQTQPASEIDPGDARSEFVDDQKNLVHSVVLDPSPGRPAFVKPGESFYCLLRASTKLGKQAFVSLTHSRIESLQFPLKNITPLAIDENRSGHVVLEIQAGTPEGLYNLRIKGENETVVARNAINVVDDFKSRFRFVHLSDMNIGDPAAPHFDETLVNEINLLAPEFIIATGDFTEWGHALNRLDDWLRVLDFFAKFDAPAFLLCGDHDHARGFTTYVVNSPVGSFTYGGYHVILLFDNALNRIDDEQLRWLKKSLEEHRDATFNVIATHADELDFLHYLNNEIDNFPDFAKQHGLRMILTGGSSDWDYEEFSQRLSHLSNVHYIRTHQASTALRGRATGVSHYRVIEVDGEKLSYVYRDDGSDPKLQQSISVGRLRTFFDGPNDGSATEVSVTLQNSLNQAFDHCRVRLRVKKNPKDNGAEPRAAGGRLTQALDAGDHWLCEIRFDLPDKGGFKVVATTVGQLPAEVPLKVNLVASDTLSFKAQKLDLGLTYYQSDAPLAIQLTNPGEKSVKARPVVRLNGNTLPVDPKNADTWPPEVLPGQTVSLPLQATLSQLSVGEHMLQVYFLEDPLRRIKTFPVTLQGE